jgi:hypothetical protein
VGFVKKEGQLGLVGITNFGKQFEQFRQQP